MSEKTRNIPDLKKYAEIARRAAAEGAVLLRNENSTLPVKNGQRVSLFGRSQFDYYKTGTGSGGMVNVRYEVGILDAVKASGHMRLNEQLLGVYESWLKDNPFNKGTTWQGMPWSQEEMPLTDQIVKDAAESSDIALVVIGRLAGEGKDNSDTKGSYLLTDVEEDMLEKVCRFFGHVAVILNTGNIIDMKWVEKYKPSSVLYCWQGGQEGGNAVHDVLTGKVNPCGRLSDTIAYDITDYPSTANFGDSKLNYYKEDIYVGYRYFETAAKDKVLYPFGFGLSYTSFVIDGRLDITGNPDDGGAFAELLVSVKNTGTLTGRDVIQVYLTPPQGKLGKPYRTLIGFAKTKDLKPGEAEEIHIKVPFIEMASYDDSGITEYKSCFVLEAGKYTISVGHNVRDAEPAGAFNISETIVTEQLREALSPVLPFERMKPVQESGRLKFSTEAVPQRTYNLQERIREKLPVSAECTGDRGFKLLDVVSGKASMSDFLNQLSDFELCCLTRGEGMSSPKAIPGSTGVFGGVTEALAGYGIPVGCCCDGPSGIRLDSGARAFSIPCGTNLACTFDTDLVTELFEMVGRELRQNHVDLLLGPGMNIHRNPLNGRNFEYFSEDPLLTGKMAAAQLIGLHKWDVSGVIKHYAANNQEHERYNTDGAISERALREIYLKGYEIAVKQGGAFCIMSTYGSVNGLWTAGSYDLLTTILREEWGFNGIIMTDWWAQINTEGEPPSVKNLSAMVRAQNDLYMVVRDSLTHDDTLAEGLKTGAVTRGELLCVAANICDVLVRLAVIDRYQGIDDGFGDGAGAFQDDPSPCLGTIKVGTGEPGALDISIIDTTARAYSKFKLEAKEAGSYTFDMRYRIDGDMFIQNPFAVLIDNKPAKVVVFNGTGNKWVDLRFEIDLPVCSHINLFFSHGGVELDNILIKKA